MKHFVRKEALLLLFFVLNMFVCAYAQNNETKSTKTQKDLVQNERLILDKEKYKNNKFLEEQRLQIDRQKLEVEKNKAFWSMVSIVLPILIGAVTIGAGFWKQYEQNKLQFELKSAEIIFAAKTPQAAENRLNKLKTIFGSRLANLSTKDFKTDDEAEAKEPEESKIKLIDLLVANPDRKDEIIELWYYLFPGDSKWLKRVNESYFAKKESKNKTIPQKKSKVKLSNKLPDSKKDK